MNAHEATRVLVLLTAAWPDVDMPEATATLWLNTLLRVDPVLGMEAAETLTRTSRWFPKLSEYLEQVQALKRRDALHAPREIEPPPADRSLQQARMLALREMTANIGKGGKRVQTHTHALAGCPGCAALDERIEQLRAGVPTYDEGAA